MTTMVNQETVYGTNEDSHVVMSEKVQTLAGSIYQEFEKMISKYDQDVVKGLMPLVVNVLECLDLCYTENQEQEVEIELLKEDNEQLVTQYEREKQLRKDVDKKYLEVEDAIEEEKKSSQSKIESLESILRMFELKARNAGDHVSRLEEKETEMKTEYNKLHERYTDLFKTHMDYMERTKILMGTDRLEHLGVARNQLPNMHLGIQNRSSGPISFGFTSLENALHSLSNPLDVMSLSSPKKESTLSTSLRNEIQDHPSFQDITRSHTQDKGQITDTVSQQDIGTVTKNNWVDTLSPECDVQLEDLESTQVESINLKPKSLKTKEERQDNNLYQELKFQEIENPVIDNDDLSDITGGWVHPGEYASSGMGKEVENLIMENNELLATKNALNIVKDDLIAKVDELTSEQEILREEISSLQAVKSRLKLRVQELTDELKQVKQEAEKMTKANKSDDEEDVPMSQRKRFTRVEMARVLMDRNQYKEKLMELQEAVRLRDMLRASQTDGADDKKKNKGIWTLFSNLFTSSDRAQRNSTPVKFNYNVPSHQITPSIDGIRRSTAEKNRKNIDFLDNNDYSSEKLLQRRANERREQYRQVKAHVKKDDGRLQAYGWSLPAKIPGQFPSPLPGTGIDMTRTTQQIPVPVPVFCRPLRDQEPGMKIWCAAGVNLSCGKTRDGGLVIGGSVFYSEIAERSPSPKILDTSPEVDKLDAELREQEKIRRELGDDQLTSSLVWICTSTHSMSKVTIIDAKSPDDALGSFNVCSSHLLCIASVPGAKETDYSAAEELHDAFENSQQVTGEDLKSEMLDRNNLPTDCKIGNITFVSCSTGVGYENNMKLTPEATNSHTSETPSDDPKPETKKEDLQLLEDTLTCAKDMEKDPHEGSNVETVEKMSSVQPTMWLGSQNGSIYVHSSVAQWDQCIHSVVLPDSVLAIVHISGRVLAALADGKVAVFHRGMDGQWDLENYHLVEIGPRNHSVRCMVVVHDKVWCGFQNKICVMDPKTMKIESYFIAHPRKESQVRQMACAGDGVWVSIRLDSTLRLYHAHTYEHLQDVDIEPYVSKMLGTGKLGFSFVRITALLISASRLWMGTGNGVIISVPFEDTNRNETGVRGPGTGIRVYCKNDRITPGSFIPYCSMAHAQLSFHGHRDSVKFFVSVPGSSGLTPVTCDRGADGDGRDKRKPSTMLVMAGGEGYIDFRIGENDEFGESSRTEDSDNQAEPLSKGQKSHLIVWQTSVPDTKL